MEIRQLTKITPDVVLAFGNLIPQLSENIAAPSSGDLEKIIDSSNTMLFVAEEDGLITGTLTLVMYRIPTGMKAWIEDVVVDRNHRGKGIGKMLTQYAIDFAKKAKLGKIDLTSSPSRIEANLLYQKMGFNRRETNVYRLEIL